MEISFTLQEMENVYMEALKYSKTFKNSIESLKMLIEELPKYWTSEETSTYEVFLQMFQQKYKKLIEISEKMNQFCEKINEQKVQFQQASKNVIDSFE
ncbi:MAG: hypothetical protein IKE70_02455 [Bacilli bacterium]|nr:hypothetical protein [Bacilli bacterium]